MKLQVDDNYALFICGHTFWKIVADPHCTHLLLLHQLLTNHLQPCWLTLQWENGNSFRLRTLLKTWTDIQQQTHRKPLSRNADNTADKFNSWTSTTDCSLYLVDQTLPNGRLWQIMVNRMQIVLFTCIRPWRNATIWGRWNVNKFNQTWSTENYCSCDDSWRLSWPSPIIPIFFCIWKFIEACPCLQNSGAVGAAIRKID